MTSDALAKFKRLCYNQFHNIGVKQSVRLIHCVGKYRAHFSFALLMILEDWTPANKGVCTQGYCVTHIFPTRTKITPPQCKADNGLPTPIISRTHIRSAQEV